ncbi:hypothetical protein ABIA39_006733 [Nocardia sp. GAS34]|uniref:sigma factor n=1 Tax=unclassified Nocardia TaxID=2637762 RepID=UPI003D1F939E
MLAIVRDRGYAEETRQDVYLQIWRSAAEFDEQRGSAVAWLRTLAHRQAVNRVRHERAGADHEHAWGVADHRPPVDSVLEETLLRHELRSGGGRASRRAGLDGEHPWHTGAPARGVERGGPVTAANSLARSAFGPLARSARCGGDGPY